jgi:hypothetical protein
VGGKAKIVYGREGGQRMEFLTKLVHKGSDELLFKVVIGGDARRRVIVALGLILLLSG